MKINKYFSEIRKMQIFAIILGTLDNIVMIGSSILIQKIIDALISGDYDAVKETGLFFLIVLIFSTVLGFFFQYNFRTIDYVGSFQLRRNFFKNFLTKKYAEISKVEVGDILTSITSDTEKISKLYATSYVSAIILSLQFIITISIIAYFNIYVAVLSLAIVLIGASIGKLISKKIGEYSVLLQKISGKEQSSILQTINGIRTVKQLKKEAYFLEKYKIILDDKADASRKLARQYAFYVDIFSFIMNTMPFLTILMSMFFIMKGSMTVGDAVGILSIAASLTEPVTQFGEVLNALNISKELIEKNRDMFLVENHNENIPVKNIEFNNLLFNSQGYNLGEREILKNIKFNVLKNNIYTIVGKSGSGKTTIFNLISKFLPQKNVEIKINNQNLDQFSDNDIYDIAVQIDQTSITINDTIIENVLLGDSFPEEEIEEALKATCVDDIIKNKSKDFIIDASATNVSGGERQRIAIARIILRKPDLIMMDEPTSALDEATSQRLVNNLKEFTKKHNITLMVISHKKDFTQISDEIINVE